MTTKKRQSPGDGSIRKVTTASGRAVWEWSCTVELADGTRKRLHRRAGTRAEAKAAMDEALGASRQKAFSQPSKLAFGEYLATWLDGLRLAPSTVASYRKNVRLHITPYLGAVELGKLTPQALTALYVKLEKSGRRDGRGEGLGARTVRYVHTIISAALRDAAEQDMIKSNPAAKAKPPTAKQAKAPEMHPWTAAELGTFLGWSREHSELFPAWYALAFTGMRRGELLALRWQDIDLAAGTVTVKRSATLVRNAGEGASIVVGPTKTNKPRVVDVDDATAAVLKSWKSQRGTLHLTLAKPGALVFGDSEGQPRHPERFSRTWNATVKRCGQVPAIRLHDLRHTHATLLLADREPVSVVSERLGHASEVVTLTIYSHVIPGDQKRAANRFAELVSKANEANEANDEEATK